MANTVVLGGTGLLGSHTITQLLAHGHEVTAVSLPGSDHGSIPAGVSAVWADINTMPDEQVVELFSGAHAVFYAVGADERTIPQAPAVAFFYRANVLTTQRVARLARHAGVKKFVLFGSYTAEMAQRWTDFDYAGDPYPRTRLLQEQLACLEGEGGMDVMTLRLPYIFGLVAGQRPLWQFLIGAAEQRRPVLPVLGGTTSAVTARQVGEAAVGAMEHGTHGATYPINSYNLSYAELNRLACEAIGRDPNEVSIVAVEAVLPAYEQVDRDCADAGREHGVPVAHSAVFQSRDATSDPSQTAVLQMTADDVPAAIRESFAWCVSHPRG